MKPHVFKRGDKWVLAQWSMTNKETGARLYHPIREAATVRDLKPQQNPLNRVAGWFREVW
jgi:hypothetical protein